MANTQTHVEPQVQNQWVNTKAPVQTESAVQTGVFGGSAEAVDAMIHPAPKEDKDSWETFNFDEIDFGKQKITKPEVVNIPEDMNKAEVVDKKVQETAVSKNIVKENTEDKKIEDENIKDENKEESIVSESAEAEPESSLENLFDDMYEKVEHLYKLQEIEVWNMLLIPDTNYSFILKSFDVDTITIHKAETEIAFSMESWSMEVFVNTQQLFSEEDFLADEEKIAEVRQKLEYFLELVTKEEHSVEAEVASKKAEEEKTQMFEDFKQF